MRCKLASTKQYLLQGTNKRFIHLATIHRGIREFIYIVDLYTYSTYIEELTGGHLSQIEDDQLWDELAIFIKEKGVGQIKSTS